MLTPKHAKVSSDSITSEFMKTSRVTGVDNVTLHQTFKQKFYVRYPKLNGCRPGNA